MPSFTGAIWKCGIKDSSVYVEVWNDTERLVDMTLKPADARGIGQALIGFADKIDARDGES